MLRRQLPLALAVIFVAALFGVRSVIAGSTALVFTTDHRQIAQPIHQQSPNYVTYGCEDHPSNAGCDPSVWVYNPTTCGWDQDDSESHVGSGVIPRNTTVSTSLCLIADGDTAFGANKHEINVLVTAPKDGLTVTLSNDKGFSLPGVRAGTDWCLYHNDTTPGPYPSIAGSNGGYGTIVTYTLSITAGSRDVRDVFAVIQVGQGIWSVC